VYIDLMVPDHDAVSPEEPKEVGLPPVNPDLAEQELGEFIDNIVPTHGYQMMPMVGIGGSAGAIAALQAFFESMPGNSGLVFVVIMHLSPDHTSVMAEMIQRWTTMRVMEAQDGMEVEPNCIYVIPPGKHLTASNGHLRLTELEREPGRRVTVDLFFRSLADTHGPHAAAIVLSGADADGTLGIKRIKERGGLTIAQDPEEAEHGGMPRAAIGSGMIDWVLPAADMPLRILDYIAAEKRLKLPLEEGPQPAQAPRVAPSESEAALREVLVFLRTRTGRDFSYYKRATIVRRISRRMQVNGLADVPSYLAFLRTHPGEAGALLRELLVSVTNFFRDRDSFAAVEARIPELFEGKGQGDTVRVWSPGCATGEEAYSLAILLLEHARQLDVHPAIQVFGCDLDAGSIQAARAGIYPETIAADVSEERLRRFFVKEHRGYRVRREVRELVLFATHDLLKDAPFSRLDLISCRNLFIYLNREAQTRVLEIFHFALNSEGLLFLGSSEVVEDGSSLFQVVDKKHRIYCRKRGTRIEVPVPPGPSTLLVREIEQQAGIERAAASAHGPVVVPPTTFTQSASLPLPGRRAFVESEGARVSWGELHFKLIERFGPPSVLVDAEHEIQHLSESAGSFLQFVGGEPTTNLLRLVNPALRIELRSALFRAARTGEPAAAFRVPMDYHGQRHAVDIRVTPAKDLAPGFLLVSFDLREAALAEEEKSVPLAPPNPVVQDLEREVEQMKAHLRETVEQHEASTEELKASNEELQAMNEELRSATEELETSREELQSINEELSTVNAELKNKVEELGHANSDLQNLMSATEIATLFLDREMRIMRYTSSAAPMFNLIPGDVGRPISDLQRRVDYPELSADTERVVNNLVPIEREVNGPEAGCYMVRILPYRTVDDRIAGVVLTFVDITERKQNEAELHTRNEELERFNRAAVGRELRMLELKKEVNSLLTSRGGPERYRVSDDEPNAP
jgi:two-component system, chemotaxis family, CheB/CheR fusion protein